MPIDRTSDFRQCLEKSKLLFPQPHANKSKRPAEVDPLRATEKAYMAEAHTILNHVTNLTRMLANVRRPYLNIDSSNTQTRARAIDLQGESPWAEIRYLTNEERDQIDTQARVILSRCADRVKQMEEVEKKRAELATSKQTPSLLRLLPARLTTTMIDTSNASADFLAAHNASVTWYLNRRLAEASKGQKEMQEERIKRQLERTRTLGSAASGSYAPAQSEPLVASSSPSTSWFGQETTRTRLGGESELKTTPQITFSDDESDYDDLELSASQIQQFESENAQILSNVQSMLQSVQQAESRLLDIAALQMELVAHLTAQSEITEQLYDDAVSAAAKVEQGNEQLREAKRRAGDSRMWILIFLIGASFALLFIHSY